MPKVQHVCQLSPQSVTKLSRGSVMKKRTRATTRPASSRVRSRKWSDGVHPLIVAKVASMGVDPRRIEVVGPEELVIR